MSSPLTDGVRKVFRQVSFVLSAAALLVDVAGLGKLAYDVVARGQLTDIGFKLIVLVAVFLFGIGLGILSVRGFANTSVYVIARFYAWTYLGICCISYLGIAFVLHQQHYTAGTFAALVVVLAAELLAVGALHVVIEEHDIRPFSLPLLAVCVVHALLIVYGYVFKGVPVSGFLAGDLIVFIGMTLVSSAMLGEMGFGSMFGRLGVALGWRRES